MNYIQTFNSRNSSFMNNSVSTINFFTSNGYPPVTIASKEIDCADRIVHETGIHKDIIVDSTTESDCFLNIEE